MKVLSAIVGVVLILVSFALAYLSSNNANEMIIKKDAIVMKYIKQSDEELENNNINAAIRYVKLAILADPKSKKAFKTYENILKVKYKPEESSEEDNEENDDEEQDQEGPEVEEEAPDMGC